MHPLSEGGKHFWTKDPEGLKKWATHEHPWTELYHHILKWEGMTPHYAKEIAGKWYFEVFGHGPTAEGIKKVPRSLLGVVVARELQALLRCDMDDDSIGEIDDDTFILLQALAELDEESGVEGRAWNPAQHMRWPKGHPKAGKFKPMVDLLKEAIRRHDGVGHPFDHFKREQLVKAAKVRGITLKRGEDRNSIAAKLLADVGAQAKKEPPPPPAKKAVAPKKKADNAGIPGVQLKKVKQIFAVAPDAYEVNFNGRVIGHVHGDEGDPEFPWVPFRPAGGSWDLLDPGGKPSKAAAVKELVDSYEAAKAAKPAMPKVNHQDEVKAKIANDQLEDLKYPDLVDLALLHNVKVGGRQRAAIIADIRQKIGAAKTGGDPGQDIDKMRIGDLVKLAGQHGISLAGKARPELVEELKQRMQPHGPGKYHRDLTGLEDLHDTVENGAIVDEKTLAGGAIGDTRLRKYADGTKVVWKRSGAVGENDSEQLSSMVARALGLPAPRIYRNRDHEVNMDFVEGDVASAVIPGFGWMVGDTDKVTKTDEGRMMGLLDQLIANTDRHNGNWMIRDDDGRLVPIDHGYAFGNRPGQLLRDGGKSTWVKSAFAEHYSTPVQGKMEWQDNDLTKRDITELRRRIAALKPDFEHLGRGNWHQFMMDRLDAIGQHATGKRSRLLPPVV